MEKLAVSCIELLICPKQRIIVPNCASALITMIMLALAAIISLEFYSTFTVVVVIFGLNMFIFGAVVTPNESSPV